MLDDSKEIISRRKSKTIRTYTEKTNKDLQNTTEKTKQHKSDYKSAVNFGRVNSYYSIIHTRPGNVEGHEHHVCI